MSLEICILASGSSGNCSAVRCPAGVFLIDAGIGPRTTARRLAGTGVDLSAVSAVCLTHLDRDHFTPHWLATLIRQRMAIFCHQSICSEILAMAGQSPKTQGLGDLLRPFDGREFAPLPGLKCSPIRLAHDRLGSHGFLLDGFGCRLGYATDLGRVPDAMLDQFRDLDILALESNYDPQMQLESSRPWVLKRRIMGGRGHLSNQQALGAVRSILDRAQVDGRRLPSHIVLLHRSRQCNCPNLLRSLFSQDPRIASRLTLADQFERSEWLGRRPVMPAPGEQLVLVWG